MIMRENLVAGFVLLALGTGCAPTARTELTHGLMAMGFSERPARCIAREMDERLAPEQMQKLTKVIRDFRGARNGDRSVMNVLESAMRINDPNIAGVALSAGAGCLLQD